MLGHSENAFIGVKHDRKKENGVRNTTTYSTSSAA
jgi:hypothetical protein